MGILTIHTRTVMGNVWAPCSGGITPCRQCACLKCEAVLKSRLAAQVMCR